MVVAVIVESVGALVDAEGGGLQLEGDDMVLQRAAIRSVIWRCNYCGRRACSSC